MAVMLTSYMDATLAPLDIGSWYVVQHWIFKNYANLIKIFFLQNMKQYGGHANLVVSFRFDSDNL